MEPEIKLGICRNCNHTIIRINGEWLHKSKIEKKASGINPLPDPEMNSETCPAKECTCAKPEPEIND